MPLTPKYTWSESQDEVLITVDGVPIKDQSQVFCSDAVVKLNAAPYLLLLDLNGTVDEDKSTATVHGQKLQIRLQKVTAVSVSAWRYPQARASPCSSEHGIWY